MMRSSSKSVVVQKKLRSQVRIRLGSLGVCLLLALGIGAADASAAVSMGPAAFLASLTKVTSLGTTVPANGDVNPYGIAIVPKSAGLLHAGDLLISNFNGKSNNQGTGTTIDELTTAGQLTVFATVNPATLPGACPGGVGSHHGALAVLPSGYVVVGSLPTTNGQSATAKAGCLIVLDSNGKAVKTISGPRDRRSLGHDLGQQGQPRRRSLSAWRSTAEPPGASRRSTTRPCCASG